MNILKDAFCESMCAFLLGLHLQVVLLGHGICLCLVLIDTSKEFSHGAKIN